MRQSAKPLSPKANKALLITNFILFFIALVLGILNLRVREWVLMGGMVFVMLITALNAYGCWLRMRRKQ